MSEESTKPKFNPTPKKSGLAALLEEQEKQATIKREAAAAEKAQEIAKTAAIAKTTKASSVEYIEPDKATDKIRIIFDDSGSMAGDKIKDAREGVIEFLKNCAINQTAVAVHPLEYQNTDLTKLTTNLPALSVLVQSIPDTGGTPLFQTLQKAQQAEPKATRFVVFSDGAPNWGDADHYKDATIAWSQQNKVAVDTVLIVDKGSNGAYLKESSEYLLLQELAEKTGGYFLVFDRNKMDFKQGFKYLAPSKRLMLASASNREALQEGKLK